MTITTIHMLDAAGGWATGTAGPVARQANGQPVGDHVLATGDGGQSWRDVTPPEPAAPAGAPGKAALAFFPDNNQAWVTYYDPLSGQLPAPLTVWRTADGGQSWQPGTPLSTEHLVEIFYPKQFFFADASNGWLAVHVGVGMSKEGVILYHTQDGGLNWEVVAWPAENDPPICYKTGMSFTSELAGWITGYCGPLYGWAGLAATGDGGRTWATIDLPLPDTVPDVTFCESGWPAHFSPQAGLVTVNCVPVGENTGEAWRFLFTTADGGQSWQAIPYPGGAATFLDPSFGWALGQEIHQTHDGGQNWTLLSQVDWSGLFSFVDQQNGWAVAYNDTEIALVQTTDGGRTWQQLNPILAP